MANSSFFGGNPTPAELADLEALVAQVEADAAEVAQGVSDAAQSVLDAAAHASNASVAAGTAGASQAAAEAAATNADVSRAAAQTARTGAETARTGAGAAETASEAARDLTLAYRDTTLTYRNDAQTFRNAAEGFKNDAAASALAAATFDPANFYTKVQSDAGFYSKAATDALLLPKAPLAAPAFTGVATFDTRPTFAGQVPWDAANLPTTSHGRSLVNTADAKASRVLIGADRNYAGAITATNNMTFSNTESGLFYQMNLSGGVLIASLPAVAGIQDGHSVVVRAVGVAGYGAAYIAAEAGKTITYRNYTRQAFNLIGQGETFRFTWLAGLNVWLAECLVQPGEMYILRSHSGSGVWNGTSGAWNTMFFTATTGYTNNFGYSGFATLAPVIGVYSCIFGVRLSAASGGGVSGYGYLAASNPATNIVSQAIAQTFHNFFVGQDDDQMTLSWAWVYDAGQFLNAHYLTSTVGLQHWYDNNQCSIALISR